MKTGVSIRVSTGVRAKTCLVRQQNHRAANFRQNATTTRTVQKMRTKTNPLSRGNKRTDQLFKCVSHNATLLPKFTKSYNSNHTPFIHSLNIPCASFSSKKDSSSPPESETNKKEETPTPNNNVNSTNGTKKAGFVLGGVVLLSVLGMTIMLFYNEDDDADLVVLDQTGQIITFLNNAVSEYHVNTLQRQLSRCATDHKLTPNNEFLFGMFGGFISHDATIFCRDNILQVLLHQLFQLERTLQGKPLLNSNRLKDIVTQNDVREVQNYLKQHLDEGIKATLQRAFFETDIAFIDKTLMGQFHPSSGTSALVGYLTNHYLFVANAGDCRALLVAKGTAEDGSTKWLISDLATPHTADTEAERLHKQFPNDSDIVKNGMVKGLLKPSRGIGIVAMKHPQFTEMITQYTDVSKDQWKPPYITPAPDVTLTSLHPDDKYCIIATHEVWDCLNPVEVVNVVLNNAGTGKNLSTAILAKARSKLKNPNDLNHNMAAAVMILNSDVISSSQNTPLQLPSQQYQLQNSPQEQSKKIASFNPFKFK